MKVNLCFLKPVIPWKGLNLNAVQCAQQANENNLKLNGVVFELILIYSLQIECNFNHYFIINHYCHDPSFCVWELVVYVE